MGRSMRSAAILLALLSTLWSLPLAAQAPERTPVTGVPFYEAEKAQSARATQLLNAGLAAQKRGKHEEALKAFRASYGVVRTPEARVEIVRALSALGRHNDAYKEAVEALDEATQAAGADAQKYGATAEAAQAELDAAAEKVALVVVNVRGDRTGAALVVNGIVVDLADWGRPIPVDAGPVEAALTNIDGELTETAQATVGQTVEIGIGKELPAAAPKPKPRAAPVVVDEGDSLWPAEWPDRKLIAIIAGGTSVVAFVNFGIFGLLSDGQADRLDSGCPAPHQDCDPLLEDEADKGRTFQAVANTFLVIGIITGAAAGGFLTWDLLDPDEEGTSALHRPKLTVGAGAVSLTGSF